MKAADVEGMQTEIEILRTVSHPNIVGLLDVFEDPTHYCLVMDLMEGGELFDYIITRSNFNEALVRQIMVPLFDAVFYCHELNIVHRDLKPENLLLDSKDLENAGIKITDFGLGRFITAEELATTTCGTPGYVAPEVLSKVHPYDYRCDYWSLGVVMYIMLSGAPPFYHEDTFELFEIIASGKFNFEDDTWNEVSKEAKDLISRLLVVDPNKRASSDEIRAHPWMSGEFETPTRELKSAMGCMKRWDTDRKKVKEV